VIATVLGLASTLPGLAALVARAGGGQGFDDGGGGGGGGFSGGGGGGGGGGFFFFGGGAGGTAGGGAVLFIALILLLVIFRVTWPRIRSRRGWSSRGGSGSGTPRSSRTSGGYGPDGGAPASTPPATNEWSHDDRPAIDSVRGDLFPGTTPPAERTSAADGLAAIAGHDPGFNEETFLESVQRTFFIVQEAWCQRKPEMSRQVMADGLWQQHRVQIQGYVDAKKRNVLEDLAVGNLSVIAAHRDTTYDTITVRVRAACADYDVDDESGRTVRGDRQVRQWSEDWTFQRAASATTPTGGGTLSARCPNCGAPLDLDLSGECKYCKAPVSSGSYDWVLARIAQVPTAGY
jgi:predicted lipid-binding transport protein (Tim44 family)